MLAPRPLLVRLLVAIGLLACGPLLSRAHATLNPAVFKVGSFAKNTSTGNQTVTHNLGVTPKAVIFFTNYRTNETLANTAYISVGFYDGTTQKSASSSSSHNVTSDTARQMTSTAIQMVNNGASATLSEASVTAWTTTTLTLNWSTADAVAAIIHYVIIGGSHVSAAVREWNTGTTAGNISISSFGLKPNVCIHASTGVSFDEATPHREAHHGVGVGVMAKDGTQWSTIHIADDNKNPSQAYRAQETDSAIMWLHGDNYIAKELSYVSMDTNGFTMNLSGVSLANSSTVVSLCLQSLNAYAGSFTKSTSTSVPVAQTITGPSFTPGFLFLASDHHTTTGITNEGRVMYGIADGTNEGVIAVTTQNNNAAPDSYGQSYTSKVAAKMNNNSGAGTEAEADFSSFNSSGFALSWSENDAVATQYVYLALGTPSASAIELESFDAKHEGDELTFRWRTGFEHDSMGFNIIEDKGGIQRRLNPELIAGSAFLVGAGQRIGAGASFFWKTRSRDPVGARYWLEEVDTGGNVTKYGPFAATHAPTLASLPVARLLSQVGQTSASGRPSELTLNPLTAPPRRFADAAAGEPPRIATADTRAVKIAINDDGWYRVTGAELIGAGLSPDVDPRSLQLVTGGRELAAHLVGQDDGRLDPTDALEFYGLAEDTAHTDARTYWVIAGRAPGVRIPPASAPPSSVGPAASFSYAVTDRPRSIYFAALLNGGKENLFGPVVSAASVVRKLVAHHVETEAPASVALTLQGASETAHDVTVIWNGQELEHLRWQGRTPASIALPLPAASVREGDNQIELRSAATTDVSLIDEITLHYAHRPVADADAQRFFAPAGVVAVLGGFASANVRAFDVTDPFAVTELGIAKQMIEGAPLLAVAPAGSPIAMRTVLAVGDSRVATPARVWANQPSAHLASTGADFLIIGPGELLPAVRPLIALREAQGMRVDLVDLEDLYDELSFGHPTPNAIRDYLTAARRFAQPPKFVLLMGDASLDPRNRLGKGGHDVVPTALVDTWPIETASDDWFTSPGTSLVVQASSGPTPAIGRIPVRTVAEAEAVISKLVRHEKAGTDAQETILLIGDETEDTLDFEDAVRAAAVRARGWPTELRLPSLPKVGRPSLIEAIGAGPLIVDYVGHGSVGMWNSGLDVAGALSLRNADRLPLVVAMTCFNGMFHDPQTPSLAEALLTNPDGGAVAVIASSGYTPLAPQRTINDRFLRAVLSEHLPLGEALRVAKADLPDPDDGRTFMLFGDPSRVLTTRTPPPPPDEPDGGPDDANVPGSIDAPPEIASPAPRRDSESAGCGCRSAGSSGGGLGLSSIGLGLLLLLRRSRGR